MASTWIFQGNPDMFDVVGYLSTQPKELKWLVKQYGDRMAPGDLVYLWQAGGKKKAPSGILASCVIAASPLECPDDPASRPYWVNAEGASNLATRVQLTIDKIATIEEMIRREDLLADPACSDLLILKQPAGTNFHISPVSAKHLRTLWYGKDQRTGGMPIEMDASELYLAHPELDATVVVAKRESVLLLDLLAQGNYQIKVGSEIVGYKPRNPDRHRLLDFLLGEIPLHYPKAVVIGISAGKGAPFSTVHLRIDDVERIREYYVAGRNFRFKFWIEMEGNGLSSGEFAQTLRLREIDHKPVEIIWPAELPGPLQDPDEEFPPGTTETEKEYMRKARVGQGEFRKKLLEKYDGTCPVTGIANHELLIASHIKPWRACSHRERLDKENGILLSALVDRLFDRSLITFSEEGQVLVSSELSETDRQSCRIGDLSSIRLSDKNRIYMEYHREVFKQAQQ